MFKSQSKKAIDARRWRASAREKKRFNTVVTEYVRIKYNEIYNECHQLYNSLHEKHSDTSNLTKTRTFRRIIEDVRDEVARNKPESSAEDPADEPVRGEHECGAEDPADEPDRNETVEPVRSEPECGVEDLLDEPVRECGAEDPADEPDRNETVEPVRSEPECGVEDLLDEPVRNETVEPDRNESILSSVIEEVLGVHEYFNINEIQNIDNVINEIINDLEQNDAVRDMLEDEHVQPMHQDEDEGIGILNLEDEILEFDVEPLDYVLEVEPFEF